MKGSLPDWLTRTAAGRAVIAAAASEQSDARGAVAKEVASLTEQLERERPRLNAPVAKARQRFDAAQRELEDARLKLVIAESEAASGIGSVESRITQLRKTLRATADREAIARFQKEILGMLDSVERYAFLVLATAADRERARQLGEMFPATAFDATRFSMRRQRARLLLDQAREAADALHEAAEFDLTARFAEIREQLRRDLREALPEMDLPLVPA